MIIERFNLSRLNLSNRIQALSTLEPGDSLFFDQLNEAHSMRVLSYYFLRTRNLAWRFTFRKIDKGWRLIRTQWNPVKPILDKYCVESNPEPILKVRFVDQVIDFCSPKTCRFGYELGFALWPRKPRRWNGVRRPQIACDQINLEFCWHRLFSPPPPANLYTPVKPP